MIPVLFLIDAQADLSQPICARSSDGRAHDF